MDYWIVSRNEREINFRQLIYQRLMVNLCRYNEEYRVKSTEEQVIGSEEGAEETHDKEEEDQEEEDVIRKLEIDCENGVVDRLNSEYEFENGSV